MLKAWLLGAAFLISGAAALMFEALWFHQAGLAFGNGVWASALVLSSFMAGMVLGNALGWRYGDRIPSSLRAYAVLEVSVAISGVALVYALPSLGPALAPLAERLSEHPNVLRTLHFGISFVLLLIPATAIGMTLPLLTRAIGAWDDNLGRSLGWLYGANTSGAVVGVLSVELVTLDALGIRGSAVLAAALDVGAAVLALSLIRGTEVARPEAEAPATPSRPQAPWLAASFLAGFVLLALEVVWLRFLTLFLNDTSLVFATVLALVLLGIAVGGWAASAWASYFPERDDRIALVGYAAGWLGLGGYLVYPTFLRGVLPPEHGVGTVFRIAAPLVLPTAVASGFLFTRLGVQLRKMTPSRAVAIGKLSLYNTAGAALGSVIAGFVLLPHWGMERSLLLLFATYGVVGLLLGHASTHRVTERYAPLAIFAAGFWFFPFGAIRSTYVHESAKRWMRPSDEIVAVREGRLATIVHGVHRIEESPIFDHLATNAYSMTTNEFKSRRYMKLFVHLPAAVHPEIQSALVVGYGIGNTVRALVSLPEVRTIDVVDVSEELLEESRNLHTFAKPEPLIEPRVSVRIDDGRFFLQGTSRRYDLVTGEPPPPIMDGVSNLYTAEYFRLLREHLREGGMATYWLPLMNLSSGAAKAIVRAFCSAFSDCSLWHGAALNFILMGSRDAHGPVTRERFEHQWRDPSAREELAAIGLEEPSQLGALFVGDAEYLDSLSSDAEPLTDARPKRVRQRRMDWSSDPLVLEWTNAPAARHRFERSAFVEKTIPMELRKAATAQFELQAVLDDLMSKAPRIVRHSRVLHRLLRSTDLRLPILLLLGSTPDIERAWLDLPEERKRAPAWQLHRVAHHMANRDMRASLAGIEGMPEDRLPIRDLPGYVRYALQRQASGGVKQTSTREKGVLPE